MVVDKLILDALVLGKTEHVIFDTPATYYFENKSASGKLIFTNKRFFFVTVTGFFSKTVNLIVSNNYSDVVGVTLKTTLFIIKKLVFSLQLHHANKEFVFQLTKDAQAIYERVRELINQASHEKTIVTNLVVNEVKEDKPLQLLQKKLARGEITLEEFHKRVQRM